jgi:hypothetical protein
MLYWIKLFYPAFYIHARLIHDQLNARMFISIASSPFYRSLFSVLEYEFCKWYIDCVMPSHSVTLFYSTTSSHPSHVNVYHTFLLDNPATALVYMVKLGLLDHIRSPTSTRLCSSMSFQRHLSTRPCPRQHVCSTKSLTMSVRPRLFNHVCSTTTSRLCLTTSFQHHLSTWPCLQHHVCSTKLFNHVCLTRSSTHPRLFKRIAYSSTSVGPRLFDDAFQRNHSTTHANKSSPLG